MRDVPESRTAAEALEGLTLSDGWRVLSRVDRATDRSGGAFSVGYLAVHEDSQTFGFLKALDYSEALDDEDPARALADLTARYNAERDLLDQCGQRNLNRIVRALAWGTVRVPAIQPNAVSYLIFELADGDSRDLKTDLEVTDFLPVLRVAHDATVAMAQLHGIGATHQDVKPSNVLVWSVGPRPNSKLGDLGCAHLEGRPAPHDALAVPGDCSYAAPEQLYRSTTDRRAADMYMLGNLLAFLLVGVSHSGLLHNLVDRTLHWRRWGGTFEEVLPALVDTHGMVMRRLEPALHAHISEDAFRIIHELCQPDPGVRGDHIARRRGQNPYGLQRYVTRINLLYRKACLAGGVAP